MPNDSEHSRLLWMAAIELVHAVPAKNPAGLFLSLVKNRKWDFLSDGHFDGANARLKAYLHGPVPDVPPFLVPRITSPCPRLSRDALLVQVVQNELKRGVRTDPFAPSLASRLGPSPLRGGLGGVGWKSPAGRMRVGLIFRAGINRRTNSRLVSKSRSSLFGAARLGSRKSPPGHEMAVGK